MTELTGDSPSKALSGRRVHTLLAGRVRWLPPAVAGALGLYQLGDPSIWIDEAFTARSVTDYGYVRLGDELYWLYYTAMKPWASVAGTSEIALRLPSVLAAVAAVVLLYGFGRRFFDERVAFWASLLLAVNPYVVKWSQQARAYSVLVALVIASTWLLLRALDRNAAIAWAGYGVSAVALIYWHTFSAALFLPVHTLVAYRSRRARTTWALVLAATAPWLIQFADRDRSALPLDWIKSPSAAAVVDVARHLPGVEGFGLVLAVAGVFLAVRHRSLLVAWAILPFGLALAVSFYEPVFVDRYLIVSCPAIALLAAIAITRVSTVTRYLVASVVAAGTIVGLVNLYAPDGSSNWAGEDWKGATEFVMQEGGAEVRPDNSLPAYAYYGGRIAPTGWVVERRRYGEFPPNPHVRLYFGSKLRVLFVPG